MSKKQEIIVLAFMLVSFGLGYGYKSARQLQTVEQSTGVENNHTTTTVVTTETPDGTKKTVQTTDSVTKSQVTGKKVAETPKVKKDLNVSVMAGYDLTHIAAPTPVYGVSVTKQVIGSLTLGAFGMTNGVLGVTIGVNF